MDAKKILIIEDEKSISDIIKFNLTKEGFAVETAFDGQEGFEKAISEKPDLILLDIMLPIMDGFAVCRKIREKSNVPILMLTAKEEEVDKVLGLELGADDYITKPFSLQVLLAKIKTILRRNDRRVYSYKKIHTGDLTIDFVNRIVVSNEKRIMLTPMQFHIMEILVKNHGITVTREQITSILWNENDEFVEDNTLSVHVSNLKSKIGKYNGKPYLETIRGVGYQWKLDVILCTN